MAVIRILVLALAVLASASVAAAADRTLDASILPVCDPTCPQECRTEYAECRLDVRAHYQETFKACLDANCKTVIQQARRICTAQPDSRECAAARAQVASCTQRCRNVAQHEADEAIALCQRELKACVEECTTP